MGRPLTRLLRSQSAGDLDPRTLRFEHVYDQELAFVWRSLRSLGVPDEALEDAAQDAFLVVHRRLPELDGLHGAPRHELRAWLFAIARRIAFRYRRSSDRRARKVEAAAHAPEFSGVDDAPLPDAALAQRDALGILNDFTLGLDEDKRVAFVMYYLEDMSAPAIAAVLEVSVNTVHSRLRLCRDRFERHCHRIRARESRVLSSGRAAHVRIEPTPHQRRRAWAVLLPLLDVAVLPKVAATAGVVAQLKWFAATLALGFTGLGTASAVHHQRQTAPIEVEEVAAPSVVSTVPAPVDRSRAPGDRIVRAATPVTPASPSLSVATAVPRARQAEAQRKPRTPTATSGGAHGPSDDLDRETKAMGEIRSLSRAGKATEALASIARADEQFPARVGAFDRDRRAYEAIAHCHLASAVSEREATLQRFSTAYPDSALLPQVRARCGET